MLPPTERFSSRVDDYVKYRPTYPSAVIDLLRSECGLTSGSKVADIGAGTGIFARLLLDAGAEVFAVEPNDAMRHAAEQSLGQEPRFSSFDGTAEETGLADGSVDLVTAAQAFHWFRRDEARKEFLRILKPGGNVALVWNERLDDATPFLRGYERALRSHAADYPKVRHQDVGERAITAFFSPSPMKVAAFPNEQRFDLMGLLGRALSSSYCPQPGQPGHGELMDELTRLFEAHQEDGEVAFLYRTVVYYGSIT